MKKTILTLVMVGFFNLNGNENQINYYNSCIDRINCHTDSDCENKDVICQELANEIFNGTLSTEVAENIIVTVVEVANDTDD